MLIHNKPALVLILLAGLTWLGGSSFVRTFDHRVPDLGACGAPGDPEITCATCHSTADDMAVALELQLQTADGQTVTDYVPGVSYDASLTVRTLRGNPLGYGFQTIALKAPLHENGEEVDGFSHPADNVQFATAGGRRYAEHYWVSADSVFRFRWTAPLDADGVVSFYACGNGVNRDGVNTGDATDCLAVSYLERVVSAAEVGEQTTRLAYPNPASEVLIIPDAGGAAPEQEVLICSTSGQCFGSRRAIKTPEGYELRVVALPKGAYFVWLVGATERYRFFKW